MKDLVIKMGEEGFLGVYLHKMVQEKCFNDGVVWMYSGKKIKDFGSREILVTNRDCLWSICQGTPENKYDVVSAEFFLTSFNLKKWIDEQDYPEKAEKKEEKKPMLYGVDLSWVKGKAREVLSEAIQKVAFSKGYRWGGMGENVSYVDKPVLYFNQTDNTITTNSEFCPPTVYAGNYDAVGKEISVNYALKGKYENAK